MDGKERFVTLDALRGIAAIFVVFYHLALARWFPYNPAFAYLAVDLFFSLSGFVIASSYDCRFSSGLTINDFLLKRVIRLYPLYLMAFVISQILPVLDWLNGRNTLAHLVTVGISNGFLLPALSSHVDRWAFPDNIPAWSLFFEFYVANVAYAVFWSFLRGGRLVALVGLAAILLVFAIHSFGTAEQGATIRSLPLGFARVIFSFFLGVLLSRFRRTWRPRLQVPWWLIPVLLMAAFCAPFGGSAARAFEAACIFLFFPAAIYWGAEVREIRPSVGAALGNSSYALYVLHMPLMNIGGRVAEAMQFAPPYYVGFLFVPAAVVIGLGAHSYLDTPLRQTLSGYVSRRSVRPAHAPRDDTAGRELM